MVNSGGGSSTDDTKYDITPYDCTPGKAWEDFDDRLLNKCTRADDRGWSISDHFKGDDEGGPSGPPFGGGAAEVRKGTQMHRKRQKDSYEFLTRHLVGANADAHLKFIQVNHWQQGRTARLYLQQSCQQVANRLEVMDMDQEWDAIDILHDIGISENTMSLLATFIRGVAAKRPAAHPKTSDEQAEKFLQCIFQTSKHLSEGALIEYNSAPGNRQFELPGAGRPSPATPDDT